MANVTDICSFVLNVDQRDTDSDGYGNPCDPDITSDGIISFLDTAQRVPVFDTDVSGDEDFNGDDVANILDFALMSEYFLYPPGPIGVAP